MVNAENRERYIKLFEYLMWIRIAVMLISMLSRLPVIGGYVGFVRFLPSIAMIAVIWQLAEGMNRYRKAFILLVISFGIETVTNLVGRMSTDSQMVMGAAVVNLAASLCSFLAVYQEYNAHAELIESVDPIVAKKWHRLFNWQVALLLGTYVIGGVLAALMFMMPVIMEVYAWMVAGMQLILNWFYIQNLLAMCQSLKNME